MIRRPARRPPGFTHLPPLLIILTGCFAPPAAAERPSRVGVARQVKAQLPSARGAGEIKELQQQVDKLKEAGQYEEARRQAERLLSLRERALKAPHPDIALSLSDLAEVSYALGNLDRALSLFQRALKMREQTLGAEHPLVAESLNNMGAVYVTKGDLVSSEQTLLRALSIREKVLKPGHPDIAWTLNNLAEVFKYRGDYQRTEPLYERALNIWETSSGPESLEVTMVLNNIAHMYISKGDPERAEPILKRVLAIDEKVLGADHAVVATDLTTLGRLYIERGDYGQAEPLFRRALAIMERSLGQEHPTITHSLMGLAELYRLRKEYQRSRPLYELALAIREKSLGPEHPDVAETLARMAILHEREGEIGQAVRAQSRANEISERNLVLVLATGSEEQKRLFLDKFADETDLTVTLHLRSAPDDRDAARLALTTILRRKGRALDATSDQIGALRRRLSRDDQTLFDELSAARARLAGLSLWGTGGMSGAEYKAEVARLREEVQRLEAAVSARSAEFHAATRPVGIEGVQEALPDGAALVEFVLYRPLNKWGRTNKDSFDPPHYAAYVLAKGGAVTSVELGAAEQIDRNVLALLSELSNPRGTNYRQTARALDEQVMRPVRRLLGGARQVMLAPEGALNLIPFAALVDENDRYLVESSTLTYLTSGGDLLRLRSGGDSREGPVVVANPTYDLGRPQPSPSSARQAASRAVDVAGMKFYPLPGTAAEAKALGAILPAARVLTETRATEKALKQVRGPSVLHIATHGFFLTDKPTAPAADSRGMAVGGAAPSTQITDPLLRAGLVLAGVNQRQSGEGEDGVLTAFEAAGLDLWGTKLVVLSACDTGVGDVRAGEGVYGLRRALVLAGAESQVMSLWEVSDAATRDLMIAYYHRLQAGAGRAEALRDVQLTMLKNRKLETPARVRGLLDVVTKEGRVSDYSHPYFWASFIQSGAWSRVDSDDSRMK